jgi:hypothetical protein
MATRKLCFTHFKFEDSRQNDWMDLETPDDSQNTSYSMVAWVNNSP